jgi:hypothetical protein
MTECRGFFPGDYRDGRLRCSSCLVFIDEHAGLDTDDVAKVAHRIYQLLTHYGHHCTVQNYLPDLRAALVKVGYENPDIAREARHDHVAHDEGDARTKW